MNIKLSPDNLDSIKVVGLGCAGIRALEKMIVKQIPNIEYIAVDSDAITLSCSHAQTKIQLGKQMINGLGSGSNSALARNAAYDELKVIGKAFRDSDLIFIVAGMGRGTGSGAASILADAANVIGALTIGVVTLPYTHEGKKCMALAKETISELASRVDALIVIDNNYIQTNRTPFELHDVFEASDKTLADAVLGILNLLASTYSGQLCIEDIRGMMSGHAHVVIDPMMDNDIKVTAYYTSFEDSIISSRVLDFPASRTRPKMLFIEDDDV